VPKAIVSLKDANEASLWGHGV